MKVDMSRRGGLVELLLSKEEQAQLSGAVISATAQVTNWIGVAGVSCIERHGHRLKFYVDPAARKRSVHATGQYVLGLTKAAFARQLGSSTAA